MPADVERSTRSAEKLIGPFARPAGLEALKRLGKTAAESLRLCDFPAAPWKPSGFALASFAMQDVRPPADLAWGVLADTVGVARAAIPPAVSEASIGDFLAKLGEFTRVSLEGLETANRLVETIREEAASYRLVLEEFPGRPDRTDDGLESFSVATSDIQSLA